MLPWEMVENSTSPLETHFGPVFVMKQSRQAFSSRSEAPSEFFCSHLHPSPCDMTQQPHLALVPLKREPAARGKRAPRVPSIVGWFSLLPELPSDAESVAPPGCHLALVAARAPLAVIGEDAQHVSQLATTPGELTGVGQAWPSPKFDVPASLSHVGWSVEPAR